MTRKDLTDADSAQVVTPPLELIYNTQYIDWKSWGEQTFAKLSSRDRAYYTAELRRLNETLPANADLLEIGFGNGTFLAYARAKQWNICGTELNSSLVSIAKQFGFDAIQTSNLKEFTENSFDLVLAFDVLEHIPKNELFDFVNEIKRILKPGGHFLARFPNGDSAPGLVYQNGDFSHVTAIGSGRAHYLAKMASLEIIFCGAEAFPILGTEPKYFIHRLFAKPIRLLLEALLGMVLFPRAHISLLSPNLTAIYRKRRSQVPG